MNCFGRSVLCIPLARSGIPCIRCAHCRSPQLSSARHHSHSADQSTSAANEYLVRAATTPQIPSTLKQLVSVLIDGTILHEPGRFVILNKPFGVSCVGYKQKNGGVFGESRFDRRHPNDDEENDDENVNEDAPSFPTIEMALPFLAERFGEPNLSFCTGLKRYVSGAIVLPASKDDFKNIIKSIRTIATAQYGYSHRALAICLGKPREQSGEVSGYATFERVRNHSEYIFVAGGKAKRRARSGKFAVSGSMTYRVLATKYGCSLVDISFSKFSRHLPRLMLTELLCPILGDALYMQRIVDISGVPNLIQPSQLYRAKKHPANISSLLQRLNISQADAYSKLPLFWHVCRSTFPRYEYSQANNDRVDLVANAPLPSHMLAMLECLGMSDAAVKYLNAIAEEDDSERRFSGEQKF